MSDSPRVILVFLKFPVAGRVKTRLAAGLKSDNSGEEAVSIYKRLVSSVFSTLSETQFEQLRIQFDPPDSETEIRNWLQPDLEAFPSEIAIEFHAQSQGDLGDRLQSGIDSVFREHPNARVATIGTDCVEIQPDTFSAAFDALQNATDIIFGPTFDGGYYLVATSKPTPEIFTGIPWSTEYTLAASVKNAEAAGRKVRQLDAKNDVDTIGDWEIAKKIVCRRRA